MPGKDQDSLIKLINDKCLFVKRPKYLISMSVLFIFFLTCLVYTPALRNDFVWDDVQYVTENSMIRSLNTHSLYRMLTSFHASNWHPLTWLSLAIDYTLWDLNPLGYHLINIILHGVNTLLVFFLVIQLKLKTKQFNGMPLPFKTPLLISAPALIAPAVTALLFGLHPLHVESVAWVSERKDLLCALFVLLSILSYLSYTSSVVERHRLIWFNTCLLLFTLALMSKPMAVTLPIILLLLDIYPLKRLVQSPFKNSSVLLEKIPFFTLSIASSVITIMAQHTGGALRSLERFSTDARLFNALRTLVFYLKKMIVPVKLVPFYPFPMHIHWLDLQYLLSIILVLTITASCLWMVKKGNYLLFTVWSYYLITLLPVLGIIQVGGQAAADRYTYLSSLSIFTLIGIGVSWILEKSILSKRKRMLGGLVLLFILIFIFLSQLTIKQIRVWRNSEILWSYIINAFPFPRSDPLVHYNLGNAYAKKGELDKAISQYKQALILKPHYAEAHNNLGSIYSIKGRWDEAIEEIEQALAINPSYAMAHNNLGSAYLNKGELDKAISQYKQALVIKPDNAKAHNNLALAYYSKENYKLAIIHFDKAVDLGCNVNPKLLELLKPYR